MAFSLFPSPVLFIFLFGDRSLGLVRFISIYSCNRSLPPHLSPFVDPKEEGYVPDYALKIEQWKAAEILPLPGVGKEDLEDPQNFANLEKAKEAAKFDKKVNSLSKNVA